MLTKMPLKNKRFLSFMSVADYGTDKTKLIWAGGHQDAFLLKNLVFNKFILQKKTIGIFL